MYVYSNIEKMYLNVANHLVILVGVLLIGCIHSTQPFRPYYLLSDYKFMFARLSWPLCFI